MSPPDVGKVAPPSLSRTSSASSVASAKSAVSSASKASKASTSKSAPPAALKPAPSGEPVKSSLRETVRTKLQQALGERSSDDQKLPEEVACDIELAMFELYNQTTGKEYTAKFRQMDFNLKKNSKLRADILSASEDALTAATLVRFSAEELATDEKRQEREAIEKKMKRECQRGTEAGQATTDQFKCGRCGQRKTKYRQMQTRSADEPMTTFVSCVVCGNQWKFC